MIPALIIFWQALCNYLRGRGKLKFGPGQRVWYPLLGALPCLLYGWQFALIVALSLLNWSMWAWDDNGFCCITMRDSRNYKQNKVILPIVGWITGIKQTDVLVPSQCWLFGSVFFAIRGMCLAVLPIAVAVWSHNWLTMLLAPLCALQGMIYGTMHIILPEQDRIWVAEILQGTLIGVIISLCVGMM